MIIYFNHPKRHNLVIFIFSGFLLASSFIIYKHIKIQTKPVVETISGEQKSAPPEVIKELSKKAPEASQAAIFRIPILTYHYVEIVADKKDTIRQSLDVVPSIFEKQLVSLKFGGYTFLTARDAGLILDDKIPFPQKGVVLTFDDGYRDFYSNVFPLLKKYNIRATAYIVPGFLEKANYMTKSQLREIIDSGLVEIGAHTVHHVSLKGKLPLIVRSEVNNSKQMLESGFNIKVYSFAYPNGSFDNQAINAVKDAGFTTAVSTIAGADQSIANRYFLYRLRPGERTGKILSGYLEEKSYKKI